MGNSESNQNGQKDENGNQLKVDKKRQSSKSDSSSQTNKQQSSFMCCPSIFDQYNNQKSEWLIHFKQQCKELESYSLWASKLPLKIKKFKKIHHQEMFMRDTRWLQMSFTSDDKLNGYKPLMSKIMESDIIVEEDKEDREDQDENDIVAKAKSQKIKKLLKKSGIVEEDFFSVFSVNKEFGKFNQHAASMKIDDKESFASYVYPQEMTLKKEYPESQEYEKSLEDYVNLTNQVKIHLNDEQSILCYLKHEFVTIYVEQYIPLADNLSNIKYPDMDELSVITQAISDIQQFIRVMSEVIVRFYDLKSEKILGQTINLYTMDNLLNFMTTNIFENQQVYNVIFKLLRCVDIEREKKLKIGMQNAATMLIEEFEVPKKFRLNDQTLQYFQEKAQKEKDAIAEMQEFNESYISDPEDEEGDANKEQPVSNNVTNNNNTQLLNSQIKQQQHEQNGQSSGNEGGISLQNVSQQGIIQQPIQQELQNKSNKSINIGNQSSNDKKQNASLLGGINKPSLNSDYSESHPITSSDLKQQQLNSQLRKDPYWPCISSLRKVESKQTPISKMKTILKASEKILKCITDFYQKNNLNFNKYIDSDDLLSIFNYLTAKSGLYTMNTHCTLIDKFAPNNVLNSVSGYYLTTVQASIGYIEDNIASIIPGDLTKSKVSNLSKSHTKI